MGPTSTTTPASTKSPCPGWSDGGGMGSPSMAAWSTLRTTQHVAYRWVSRGLRCK